MCIMSRSLGGTHRPADVRVVVVGAGMAGLSAAEHLYAQGFTNLTVLEATDRIGGRIHTVNFGSSPGDVVELGAQYLGGTANTCSSWVLANQCGLVKGTGSEHEYQLDRSNDLFYRSDGRAIELEVSGPANRLFQEWFDEYVPGHRSAEQHLEQRYGKYIKNHFDAEELEDVRCVFNAFKNYICVIEGGPADDVIMAQGQVYVNIPGVGVEAPGGMEKIVRRVVRDLPSYVVKLRTPVTQIKWAGEDAHVVCHDGNTYHADHVIVTCSLGFLKKNAGHLFQPRLPEVKLEAIDNIGFGKVGKIFLEYAEPFWNKAGRSMLLAWRDDEMPKAKSKEWWKYIYTLDTMISNPNVLMVWIGDKGAEMVESLDEEEVIDKCTALLRAFCNNPTIPRPMRSLRSRWNTSPYTLGAYTYMSIKTRPKYLSQLAKPLKVKGSPRILFAGESTTVTGQGYMHGARDSGLREAETLIKLYNVSSAASKL